MTYLGKTTLSWNTHTYGHFRFRDTLLQDYLVLKHHTLIVTSIFQDTLPQDHFVLKHPRFQPAWFLGWP